MAVYFIQQQGGERLVKIGKADNVRARFTSIKNEIEQEIELLGVIAGDEREEGVLHAIFEDYRRHGEWFEPHPLLLLFIERYTTPEPPKRHIRGGGRPRNKVKSITYKTTLCLRPGRDDDLISWLQNLPQQGIARAVTERMRKGLEGASDCEEGSSPPETK